MWFWCLQASSDEERRYSCFAGERRVTYHGLQGASVEHSRSRLRGRWEERRDEEDTGRRRARGREEWSRSRRVERRGPQEERGQRRIRVPDERSRSRLSGHQGAEGRFREERSRHERTHRESPRRARSPRRRSPVRRERSSPLRSLQSGVTVGWSARETAGGSSGERLGSRARAPSQARRDSGRASGGRLSWGEWHVGEGHLAGESHSHRCNPGAQLEEQLRVAVWRSWWQWVWRGRRMRHRRSPQKWGPS